MSKIKNSAPRSHKLALGSLLITGLVIVGSTLALAANKPETIEATALGTSVQFGQRFNIKLIIEDYSTPARDFRVLIAIDVVRGFPDRFARRSDRYAMPAGKSVADMKNELQGVLASELAARKISYTRSDGSQWTLSVKDVVDRAVDFEMAYNPNDCVELRWGALQNSEEAATCKRHAPQAQRAKMSEYRAWFRERHWPTHS